jgi:Putative addiction module component.
MQAMEGIWLSFAQKPDDMKSPAWHGDVLAARKTRTSNGSSQHGDWNEAKRRIRASP